MIGSNVSNFYASLIKRCWDQDPKKRFEAAEILSFVRSVNEK